MKTLTKRELTRQPARATALKPGESLRLEDRDGGLILMREKKSVVSPGEVKHRLEALCAGGPATDVLKMMEAED